MNPDLDRLATPHRDLDDEELGDLVRSVADGWRMPPQRLEQPTWRERTRSSARRRPWLWRLAGPAAAATLATIVLAVAAVWLTAPRGDRGTVGESPAPSQTASPSRGPATTPLPKLVSNGDLPSVTRIMVRAEGHYRLADLATGTLADGTLGPYSGPTALVPRADGGWLCICGSWRDYSLNGPTALSLTLVPLDAAGNAGARTEVRQVEGTADPDHPAEQQFQLVDANVSVAPDGKTAFFAWTARNGSAGWTAGIDVVDVTLGTVVDSVTVPAEQPAGTEGQPVSRNAPAVVVSPAGDRILLSSFWYVEAPTDPNPPSGIDRWTAPFDGEIVGAISTLPASATLVCDAVELGVGFIDSDRYYLICGAQFGELTVRRVGLDGTGIGDTEVARTEDEFSGGSLVTRSGDGLYIWDPVAAVMSRVDLGNGQMTASQAPTAGGRGPLDAVAALGRRFGHWIAPSALAKLLLEPGLVISPDGTRLYALGVGSPGPSGRGSTGVYAFDAASLDQVGHWQPTADFTSIAVSADGQFVYAAAMGGVDAGGASSRNGASVTVFDTSNGSVRLIAGKLGSTDLWFATPTLE